MLNVPTITRLAQLATNFPAWANTTPFTYQDGLTNARMLETIVSYIDKELVPYVDVEMRGVIDAWKATVGDALTGADSAVEALTTLATELDASISTRLTANETAMQEAVNEVVSNSVELQAAVVEQMIADDASAPRTTLDALYAPATLSSDVATVKESADAATVALVEVGDTLGVGRLSADNVTRTVADSRAVALQVNDDYSHFPNGVIDFTETGMPYRLYASGDESWEPRVVDGYLTTHADFNLGAYAQLGPFSERINRIGARWKFSHETVGGGVMCIALMETDFVAQHEIGQGVPRAPFHLLITTTGMEVTTFPISGGAPVDSGLGYVTFATPLAADDATLHSVDCVIDTVNGVAYIDAPDGKMYSFTNPLLRTVEARFAFNEPFRDAGSPLGKTLVKYRNFWVGTTGDTLIPGLRARLAQQNRTPDAAEAVSAFPNNDASMALSVTPSKVPGTDISFTVPASGVVILAISALVNITADGPVHLGVFNENDALEAVRTVGTLTTHSGLATVYIPYVAGTPGATRTVSVCAYNSAGTAALIVGQSGNGASQVYSGVTLTILPLG